MWSCQNENFHHFMYCTIKYCVYLAVYWLLAHLLSLRIHLNCPFFVVMELVFIQEYILFIFILCVCAQTGLQKEQRSTSQCWTQMMTSLRSCWELGPTFATAIQWYMCTSYNVTLPVKQGVTVLVWFECLSKLWPLCYKCCNNVLIPPSLWYLSTMKQL